jgi:hypothetical protein
LTNGGMRDMKAVDWGYQEGLCLTYLWTEEGYVVEDSKVLQIEKAPPMKGELLFIRHNKSVRIIVLERQPVFL